MKLLKDFTEHDVIHCTSEELYDAVHKIYKDPIRKFYPDYGFRPKNRSQSVISYYKENNGPGGKLFNIISAEDFLKANDPNYINDSYILI